MTRIIVSLVLCLHLAMPLWVWAQDKASGKSPLDYSLKQYGLILGFALLGGVVSWWAKVRKGELPMWSINHFAGELVTSAFAGLLCFWICEALGVSPLLTAAFSGICGHMGTRAVAMFEGFMGKKFGAAIPPAAPADQAQPK